MSDSSHASESDASDVSTHASFVTIGNLSNTPVDVIIRGCSDQSSPHSYTLKHESICSTDLYAGETLVVMYDGNQLLYKETMKASNRYIQLSICNKDIITLECTVNDVQLTPVHSDVVESKSTVSWWKMGSFLATALVFIGVALKIKPTASFCPDKVK